jgi:hypothetical protein
MIGELLRTSFLPFPRSTHAWQAGIQELMVSECENTSLDFSPKIEIESHISYLRVLFPLVFSLILFDRLYYCLAINKICAFGIFNPRYFEIATKLPPEPEVTSRIGKSTGLQTHVRKYFDEPVSQYPIMEFTCNFLMLRRRPCTLKILQKNPTTG